MSIRVRTPLNGLARLAFRAAYRVQRLQWFLTRPATFSAAVALWHDGRVLLVRSSYRRCLLLPGGSLRRWEPSERGARRELREETGIACPERPLRLVWSRALPFEHRQDHIDIWEATLEAAPPVCVDRREIVWADWLTPAEARHRVLLPHVAAYLEERDAEGA